MKRKPVLTLAARAARRERIVRSYLAGASSSAVGKQFGVSSAWVRTTVRQHGVARPAGRPCSLPDMTPEDAAAYAKIRRYYGAARAREMMGIPS